MNQDIFAKEVHCDLRIVLILSLLDLKGGARLNTVPFVCCSFALLLAVVALVREVRLRRALQRLVRRLLAHWRQYVQGKTQADNDDAAGRPRDRQRL